MEKLLGFSGTTNSSGVGSVSVKIPGTFAGQSPSTLCGYAVQMVCWKAWFASPSIGDYISSIELVDTDGVIPEPARAQFPNYPVIVSKMSSNVPQSNQLYYLPMDQIVQNDGTIIPSGLYLSITLQKASAIVDTYFINMCWNDFT